MSETLRPPLETSGASLERISAVLDRLAVDVARQAEALDAQRLAVAELKGAHKSAESGRTIMMAVVGLVFAASVWQVTQFVGIDNRLDAVETRVGAVETRLDAVETRLGDVETRLDAVETRLEALEEGLAATNLRLDRLVDQNTAIIAALADLTETVRGLSTSAARPGSE